jgi:hypothetical protein
VASPYSGLCGSPVVMADSVDECGVLLANCSAPTLAQIAHQDVPAQSTKLELKQTGAESRLATTEAAPATVIEVGHQDIATSSLRSATSKTHASLERAQTAGLSGQSCPLPEGEPWERIRT